MFKLTRIPDVMILCAYKMRAQYKTHPGSTSFSVLSLFTDLSFDSKSQGTASRSTNSPTSPASPTSQNIFSQPRASRRPSANYSSSSTSQPSSTNATPSQPPQPSHLPQPQPQPPARAAPSSAASPTGSSHNAPPVASVSNAWPQSATSSQHHDNPHTNKRPRLADTLAEREAAACACSHNDESDADISDHVHVINSFRRSQSQHSAGGLVVAPPTSAVPVIAVAGPSGLQQTTHKIHAGDAQTGQQANDLSPAAGSSARADSDDASSFEELAGSTAAAAGAASATATHSDADSWQIVGTTGQRTGTETLQTTSLVLPTSSTSSSTSSALDERPTDDHTAAGALLVMPRPHSHLMTRRRVSRRRSETALMAGQSPRRHFSIELEEDSDVDADAEANDDDDVIAARDPRTVQTDSMMATTSSPVPPPPPPLRQPLCCERCGKRKANMRQYVERFRQQLEAERVDEAEMRRELTAFLAYLEQSHTAHGSRDDAVAGGNAGSGSSAGASAAGAENSMTAPVAESFTETQQPASNGEMPQLEQRFAEIRSRLSHSLSAHNDEPAGALGAGGVEALLVDDMDDMDEDDFSFGDDDGIHVYGSDEPTNGRSDPKQFFNLTDIQDV